VNPRDPNFGFGPERDEAELDPMQLDGREQVPIHELFDDEELAIAADASLVAPSSLDPDWFLELHELLGNADSDLGLPTGYSARDAARVRELLARLNDDPETAARFRSYRRSVALLRGLGRAEAGDDGGAELKHRILEAVHVGSEGHWQHGGGSVKTPSIWLALSASIGFAAAASLLFVVLLGEIPPTFEPTGVVSNLPKAVHEDRPAFGRAPAVRAPGSEKDVVPDKTIENQKSKLGGVRPRMSGERVARLAENNAPNRAAPNKSGRGADSGDPRSGLTFGADKEARDKVRNQLGKAPEGKTAFGREGRKSTIEKKRARDRNGAAGTTISPSPVQRDESKRQRQDRGSDNSKVAKTIDRVEPERGKAGSGRSKAGEESGQQVELEEQEINDLLRQQQPAKQWRQPSLTAYRLELTQQRAKVLRSGLAMMSSVEVANRAHLGDLFAKLDKQSEQRQARRANPNQGFFSDGREVLLLRVRGTQQQVTTMLARLESSAPRPGLSRVQIAGQEALRLARVPATTDYFKKLDDGRIAATLGLEATPTDERVTGKLSLDSKAKAAGPEVHAARRVAAKQPSAKPLDSETASRPGGGKNEDSAEHYTDIDQTKEQVRSRARVANNPKPTESLRPNDPATKQRPKKSKQSPAKVSGESGSRETLDRDVAGSGKRQRDGFGLGGGAKTPPAPVAGGRVAQGPGGPTPGGPTTPAKPGEKRGRRATGAEGAGPTAGGGSKAIPERDPTTQSRVVPKPGTPRRYGKKSAEPRAREIEVYLILERLPETRRR